jgi:putative membrane protein
MEDKQFIVQTAMVGLAEAEISGLAMERAVSFKVRRLAQRIVLDHSRANMELIDLARKKGTDLPDTLDSCHHVVMSKLRRLFTDEFDSEFMKAVIEDHKKSISACMEECRDGTDVEVKAFALKLLHSLESRYTVAESLIA